MICMYWAERVPRFAKHLRTKEKDVTITTKTDSLKHKNRGIYYMFVRYVESHTGVCYQI